MRSSNRPVSSVLRALDVLADPWSYLILREAFFGMRRFEQFLKTLGIARNILSERLDRLVRDKVLEKHAYQERPQRFEYRLSESGRDFYPAIVALMTWGDKWRPRNQGAPLVLTDMHCGKRLRPVVICTNTGRKLSPFEIEVRDGPGAATERRIGPPLTRIRSRENQAYMVGRPCSVASALQVMGHRWSFRILRESFYGVKRFEDFQNNLDIARNILTERLNALVENGLLERRRYQQHPDRYEYVLAPAGVDLYPSLLLLMNWGDKWRRPKKGVPTILIHKSDGKAARPRLVCEHCGKEVTIGQVKYKMNYEFA